MMRRRMGSGSPQRHRRVPSDFATNGENGAASGMAHYANEGGGGPGKKPLVRRAINTFRSRLRQLFSAGIGLGMAGAVAYLFACVFFVWCGRQLPSLFSGGIGAGGAEAAGTRAGAAVDTFARRNLGDTSNRRTDVGPSLAYGIMVYQRNGYTPGMTLKQFTRMFDALYDKENTYVIHVDIKSDQELLESISEHIRPLENTHEVPSVSVSWGGVTVVERTLALMQKALEMDDNWRYFVNLGHEDYPSASQTKLRQWLKDQPDGTNFIKCWPIEGHDFFGQMERHESRVKDVHVDDFMGGVREYRSLGGKSGSQERPKSDYKFFKSLQQTMLSRQLSEYATGSAEARRLLLYMATSKAPDELYFPTLTQLDTRFSSMATCDDTRHFSYWIRPGGSWHPEYLTLDHLPLVLNATEFYIRKVEEGQGSGALLDVLDSLREGEPLETSLPLLKSWLNRKETLGGPVMKFTEGTTDEALTELLRRQSEAAESRRALFLMAIYRRRKRMAAGQAAGGASSRQPAADGSTTAKQPKLAWRKKGDNVKKFGTRASTGQEKNYEKEEVEEEEDTRPLEQPPQLPQFRVSDADMAGKIAPLPRGSGTEPQGLAEQRRLANAADSSK